MRGTERISTKAFKLDSFTKEEIINAALNTAYKAGLPVAMWRMPNQNEVNLIISLDKAQVIDRIDIDQLSNGFLFTPFDFPKKAAQYIKSDISFSFDFDEVVSNLLDSNENSLKKEFLNEFIEETNRNPKKARLYASQEKINAEVDYRELVKASIQEINNHSFDKVVPARTKHINLPEDFDAIDFFFNLSKKYENAFVSVVSIPGEGTWMGATPETLIEVSDGYFKTVSLAGTQKLKDLGALSNTSWTQKEIEEQAMVSRYIINCFKKIRLREYNEIGPKTVKAGNLVHLKTTYEVDTAATNFAELGTVMLELLHPTSAVAGMPKEASLEFLSTHESIDRGYYAGFLGPVAHNDKTHLFVNLRCLQLFKDTAALFAGAGITEDSDPEKEYLETELKFNTLLNIIHNTK